MSGPITMNDWRRYLHNVVQHLHPSDPLYQRAVQEKGRALAEIDRLNRSAGEQDRAMAAAASLPDQGVFNAFREGAASSGSGLAAAGAVEGAGTLVGGPVGAAVAAPFAALAGVGAMKLPRWLATHGVVGQATPEQWDATMAQHPTATHAGEITALLADPVIGGFMANRVNKVLKASAERVTAENTARASALEPELRAARIKREQAMADYYTQGGTQRREAAIRAYKTELRTRANQLAKSGISDAEKKAINAQIDQELEAMRARLDAASPTTAGWEDEARRVIMKNNPGINPALVDRAIAEERAARAGAAAVSPPGPVAQGMQQGLQEAGMAPQEIQQVLGGAPAEATAPAATNPLAPTPDEAQLLAAAKQVAQRGHDAASNAYNQVLERTGSVERAKEAAARVAAFAREPGAGMAAAAPMIRPFWQPPPQAPASLPIAPPYSPSFWPQSPDQAQPQP